MAKKVSLKGWFEFALADKDKSEVMSQVSLMHVSILPGGLPHQKEIDTIKILADRPVDAETLAKTIETKAGLYSQNLSGRQEFVIICKYGKSDTDATHPFNIEPATESGEHHMTSHPPTKEGQTAQSMGFASLVVTKAFEMLDDLSKDRHVFSETLMKRLVAQDTENLTLRTENREMFGLLLQSAQEKVKLDHERRMAEMKYLRESQERGIIIKMAPALINQFLGKEIFPQGVEDTSIIETIATTIPEDMLRAITSQMPPFLGGPIMARLTKALKEEREAKEKAREAGQEALPQLGEGEGGLH